MLHEEVRKASFEKVTGRACWTIADEKGVEIHQEYWKRNCIATENRSLNATDEPAKKKRGLERVPFANKWSCQERQKSLSCRW
ncbi:hypothetical protein Y1Q_0009095 [Alligator mississippiensis]|uniref:Uncharacterized protein n=1 Tax=Alligator mississippiensis TaxID=8496 RepID=A0A151M279_ALLMI|nr:hypothetical protein Y1Q_0009095 [Alligator mississippiensis]